MKEEPCKHFTPTIGCIKDICSCNKEPKKPPFKHEVRVIPKEEVLSNRSNAYEFIDFDKQEILEEAAENYNLNTINAFSDYESFIAGAKWQQERSCSEEEAKILAINSYLIGKQGLLIEVLEKYFEQLKKK